MLVALSVLIVAACVSASASAAPPACARHAAGPRLPAALRLSTACATYTVSRDGRVRASSTPPLIGEGISSMAVAGIGAPVLQDGRRIAVRAGGKTVWRSRGRFKANGVFALARPGAIAFTYYGRFTKHGQGTTLYLARFGGAELRVAAGEYPLGWTASGNLLTWGHGVQLRSPTGRLLRRGLGHLREFRFDQHTRTLLAISNDDLLERYRSRHWAPLANLDTLHLDHQAALELLASGLISIVDDHRVAVLRQDGSLFASARFPSGEIAGASGLVANTTGTAVAFVVTHSTPNHSHGRQLVELLRAGERRATLLHNGTIPLGCNTWTTLAWHNQWLIDSAARGQTLLLDTTGRIRPLNITPLVHQLAPSGHPRSIAWA